MQQPKYKSSFNDAYAFGLIAESTIAQWIIRARGYIVLPAYEIEIPSGKGPRLLTKESSLITPDMLTIEVEGCTVHVKWVEAKHKERFTWHRKTKNWQTGIDIRHYEDYLRVREITHTPVYLLFLHKNTRPSQSDLSNGSPPQCPVGLFGKEIGYLHKHEHHRDSYEKDGRDYPMVYWNHCDLTLLATLDEVNAATLPETRHLNKNASFADGMARANVKYPKPVEVMQ